MISPRARTGLEGMAEAGLQSALKEASGQPVAIETIESLQAEEASQMVVMMIASHTFRIVMTLSFPRSAGTRAWLHRIGRLAEGDDSVQGFHDAISETGNMCCGAVNREIGRFFIHTGMSTPHVIDSRSAPHVHALAHHHLRHFRVSLDDGTRFHASLCVYAREAMDFEWQPEAEPETAGELEFF